MPHNNYACMFSRVFLFAVEDGEKWWKEREGDGGRE